jgi:hypothetical protein
MVADERKLDSESVHGDGIISRPSEDHLKRTAIGLALAFVILFGYASRAQVRDRPVRPQPVAASVSGRAIILINGREQPVRRARVALTPDGGNAHTTQTDTDGAFRFDGLTAGTYRAAVDKAGFVQSSEQEPIELTRGDTRRLTVTMVPGSSVSGRITLDTGEPIANVVVTAERVLATGERQADPHFAETDDLGRFRLHTLSSGRYVLRARSDVVKADVYYPGTARAEDGQVVTLSTGQEIEGADLVLANLQTNVAVPSAAAIPSGTARITGLVYWSDTRKLATGVTVRAGSGGRWTSTTTDQEGQFTFVNIGPGRYTVVAERARPVGMPPEARPPATQAQGVLVDLHNGEAAGDVQVPLSPGRTIAGRVLDEFGDPVPGVKVNVDQRIYGLGRVIRAFVMPMFSAGTTDDLGRFRFSGLEAAEYCLRTQQTSDLGTFVQAPSGFAPTFFPGVTELAHASPVRVVDRDALDVDFSLVPAPMAAVEGVVLNVAGNPYSGGSVSIGERSTRTASDGTFVMRDLPAGPYKISTTTYEGVGDIAVDLPPESNDRPLHVTMTTHAFTTVRGRVVFDGNAPGSWRTSTRLGFFTTDLEIENATKFADDGSFAIQSVTRPGYFRASGPPGWKLESVTVDGQDVTDSPIDFTHDVNNLDVVFTHRLGSVTGTVTAVSKPVSAAMVVLFPEDPKRRAYPSRYTSVARTLFTGAFTIPDVLPGSYYALAVPLFLGDPDPDWLEKMRAFATLIQVEEQLETTASLEMVR